MSDAVRGPLRGLRRFAERMGAAANYDFCPWANRYVYWLKKPIGWLVVTAIAAGLTGAFVAPQALFVCAILLVVMALGVVWPWLAMRGTAAEISFDRRRCQEFEPVTVSLTVHNRWPWPVWGLIVERGFFRGDDQDEAATALARVPGWSKSCFNFTFHPPRRGQFPHQTPVLATGFPFGIWMAERPIDVGRQLTAWPLTANLQSLPAMQGNRLAAAGGLVDRPGHDGDVLAARPYIRGDSLRRVHWVHTARRDTLIVCERQTASRRSVLIVLDPSAFASGAEDSLDLWDWSLRVVASLCREFHSHSCDVTVEMNGEPFVVPPSTPGLHRLFDRLASFQPVSDAKLGRSFDNSSAARGDQLTFVVTSARRWYGSQSIRAASRRGGGYRAVVLNEHADERRGDDPQTPGGSGSRPWLLLDVESDPLRQLQRQWERQCHEDWSH